jgi:hypothetical protein
VTTANGAIRPGDLLVTAAKLGYAMKGVTVEKLTHRKMVEKTLR